eukprot:Clim_evm21s159 gene=Clim_evmTU21s159
MSRLALSRDTSRQLTTFGPLVDSPADAEPDSGSAKAFGEGIVEGFRTFGIRIEQAFKDVLTLGQQQPSSPTKPTGQGSPVQPSSGWDWLIGGRGVPEKKESPGRLTGSQQTVGSRTALNDSAESIPQDHNAPTSIADGVLRRRSRPRLPNLSSEDWGSTRSLRESRTFSVPSFVQLMTDTERMSEGHSPLRSKGKEPERALSSSLRPPLVPSSRNNAGSPSPRIPRASFVTGSMSAGKIRNGGAALAPSGSDVAEAAGLTTLASTDEPPEMSTQSSRSHVKVIERLRTYLGGESEMLDKSYWMPDYQTECCNDCQATFTTFRRRHHCRLCGLVFCWRCCSQYLNGSDFGPEAPAFSIRICNWCSHAVRTYLTTVQERGELKDMSIPDLPNPGISGNVLTKMISQHEADELERRRSIHQLCWAMSKSAHALEVKTHRYRMVEYPGTFVASKAVDWLLWNGYAEDRDTAISLMRVLADYDTVYFICGASAPADEESEDEEAERDRFEDEYELWAFDQEKIDELGFDEIEDDNIPDDGAAPIWMQQILNAENEQAPVNPQVSRTILQKPEPQGSTSTSRGATPQVTSIGTEETPEVDGTVEKTTRTPEGIQGGNQTTDPARDDSKPNVWDLQTDDGETANDTGNDTGNDALSVDTDVQMKLNSMLDTSGGGDGDSECESEINEAGHAMPVPQTSTGDKKKMDKKRWRWNVNSIRVKRKEVILSREDYHALKKARKSLEDFGNAMPAEAGGKPTDKQQLTSGNKNQRAALLKKARKYAQQYLRNMTMQLLKDDEWVELMQGILIRIAETLRPSKQSSTIDPRFYVHLKTVLGVPKFQSHHAYGLVISRHVVHRRMRSDVADAKVLLIDFEVEYKGPKKSGDIVPLDYVLKEEEIYLSYLVTRIADQEPDVVVSKHVVSRVAQQMLLAVGITLIHNVNQRDMEQLAHLLQTHIHHDIDELDIDAQLKHCPHFYVRDYRTGTLHQSLAYFVGFEAARGCSVVLCDEDSERLVYVRSVLDFLIGIAYHLRLESRFLLDCFSAIPDLEFVDGAPPQQGMPLTPLAEITANPFEVENAVSLHPLQSKQDKQQERQAEAHRFKRLLYRTCVLSSVFATLPMPYLYTDRGLANDSHRFLPVQLYSTKGDNCDCVGDGEDSKLTETTAEWLASSDNRQKYPNALSPMVHQQISYLYIMGTTQGTRPCIDPVKKTCQYYGQGDERLSDWLDRCVSRRFVCPRSDCGLPITQHVQSYLHGNFRISVLIERIRWQPEGGDVLMLTYCKRCHSFSTAVVASQETLTMSFCKFLELSTYSESLQCRVPGCTHSVFFEHVIYFIKHNTTIMVDRGNLDLLEISLPSDTMVMGIKEYDNEAFAKTAVSEMEELNDAAAALFAEVEGRLAQVDDCAFGTQFGAEEISGQVANMNEQLEKSRNQLEGEMELWTQAVKDIQEDDDELSQDILIKAKYAIAAQVRFWNTTIADFVNHYEARFLGRSRVNSTTKRSDLGSAKGKASEAKDRDKDRDRDRDKDKEKDKDKDKDKEVVSGHVEVRSPGLLTVGNDATLGSELESMSYVSDTHDSWMTMPSDREPSQKHLHEGTGSRPGTNLLPKPVVGALSRSESLGPGMTGETAANAPDSVSASPRSSSAFPMERELESRPHVRKAGHHFWFSGDHSDSDLGSGEEDAVFDYRNSNDSNGSSPTRLGLPHGHSAISVGEPMFGGRSARGSVSNITASGVGEKRGTMERHRSSVRGSSSTSINKHHRTQSTASTMNMAAAAAAVAASYWSAFQSIRSPFKPTSHFSMQQNGAVPAVVQSNELSTVIAYALADNLYRHRVVEGMVFQKGGDSTPIKQHDSTKHRKWSPGCSFALHKMEEGQMSKEGGDPQIGRHVHIRSTFVDKEKRTTFYCKSYFACAFHKLREKLIDGGEDAFVRSLRNPKKWRTQGGKSGSEFRKTADDRFILKEMSWVERQYVMNLTFNYLKNIEKIEEENKPSLLVRILGVFRVVSRGPTGKVETRDIVVMENLFFGRQISMKFDLKGSLRSRYVEKDRDVLLDENLLEFLYESPIFLRSHAKVLLREAILSDTSFLCSQKVMDYSLLVGIDETNGELVCGIIDYIRTFTWDKKVEMWVKSSGILGGVGKLPTVISPVNYMNRFREAMDRYFLMVPDKWTGMSACG